MKLRSAIGVAVRVMLFVVLSWGVVGFAVPTPDPFAVALIWLAGIAVLLGVRPSRRRLLGWIRTGRIGLPKAT